MILQLIETTRLW